MSYEIEPITQETMRNIFDSKAKKKSIRMYQKWVRGVRKQDKKSYIKLERKIYNFKKGFTITIAILYRTRIFGMQYTMFTHKKKDYIEYYFKDNKKIIV